MGDEVFFALVLIAVGVWWLWGFGWAMLIGGGVILAWCLVRVLAMGVAAFMAYRKLPRE